MAKEPRDVEMRDDDSDEQYNENADEDFNPDQAANDEDLSSSSGDEEGDGAVQSTKNAKKRKAETADEELDSGDEATIKERRKKRRKKDGENEDESGGEGGLIRTRAQRLVEKTEKKQRRRATQGEVTIDVEGVWAALASLPIGRAAIVLSKDSAQDGDVTGDDKENQPNANPDEMITIKRRIEFAGQVTEVEESVPRSSKEAQKYLAEHPEADTNSKDPEKDSAKVQQRPLKRPSIFEPNPTGLVKGVPPENLRPRAPSRIDVLLAEKKAEEEKRKKAEKMSTVQKSALDWKGFVDQEGLREELDEYGKSKKGFLAREAFLDRAAGAREQAARDARLKL